MKTKITNALAISVSLIISVTISSCKKEEIKGREALISAETLKENINTNGLVAWYTFNGDVLDHSGYGNNVAFNNATPAVGKNGLPNTAYQFNGTSNYMKVLNSSSINKFPNGITLIATVKPEGFYTGPCHGNWILLKGNDVNANGNYLLAFDDQKYYNYNGCDQPIETKFENFYGSFGDGPTKSLGAVSDDYIKLGWYKLAYVCNNKVGKFYVNGVLKGTKINEAFSFTPNSQPLFIGRTTTAGYPYWFNGLIDDIKIYNRALNIQEVKQLPN